MTSAINMTQAHAFAYHEISGRFKERIEADPDPLREGCFLYPAHTTLTQPPAVNKPHETVRFNRSKKSWDVVKAWAHQDLYVKATREPYRIGTSISFGLFDGLGDLPDWLTNLKPPSEFHIWQGEEGKGGWILDEECFKNDVILKRQQLMDEAETKILGYRDMYLIQHLADNEQQYYLDLARYKYELIQLDFSANLDQDMVWPVVPVLKK